jgi:hypothetical protein
VTLRHERWLQWTAEVDDGRLVFDILFANQGGPLFSYLLFWRTKIDNHVFLFDGRQDIFVRFALLRRTDINVKFRNRSLGDRLWRLWLRGSGRDHWLRYRSWWR